MKIGKPRLGRDEDERRRETLAAIRPTEGLDRRHAHQADERQQQGDDEPTSDRLQTTPPVRRRP